MVGFFEAWPELSMNPQPQVVLHDFGNEHACPVRGRHAALWEVDGYRSLPVLAIPRLVASPQSQLPFHQNSLLRRGLL